jgi:hypothetical protein
LPSDNHADRAFEDDPGDLRLTIIQDQRDEPVGYLIAPDCSSCSVVAVKPPPGSKLPDAPVNELSVKAPSLRRACVPSLPTPPETPGPNAV